MVLPQNELSDHSKIVTELKEFIITENLSKDGYDWENLQGTFVWDNALKPLFTEKLKEDSERIREINQRIEAGLIRSTGEKLQELFVQTAITVFNPKQPKNKQGQKNGKYRKHNKQKWFDTECNNLKLEVRKLGRYKGKDPNNSLLREKYHEKLRVYRKTCNSKKYTFWQNNFILLEKSCNDPKVFWEKWKSCAKSSTNTNDKITGASWHTHFSSLHSNANEVSSIPKSNTQRQLFYPELNSPFTLTELIKEIDDMKTNKTVGYDRISNEMLKSCPENLKVVILNFINLCLQKSLAPNSICKELITPIHKSELADDPNNYRGICVSSALMKLFTSLISKRL